MKNKPKGIRIHEINVKNSMKKNNWEERFYTEFRDLIDCGRYDDVKAFISQVIAEAIGKGKKAVYKDNYYKHHSKRLELRKKYYKNKKEKQISLSISPVMCKCFHKREDHYDNWGNQNYTGCNQGGECGCVEFKALE